MTKYKSKFAKPMQKPCYHCGLPCEESTVQLEDKSFCCNGCKTVYEILNQHELTDFYALNQQPGIKPNEQNTTQFQFLDTPEIFEKIIDFHEEETAVVTFHIPVIHCSSCVWVLESLNEIDSRIIQSTVNFTQRKVQITYKTTDFPLSELAMFLTQLGYKPLINLASGEKQKKQTDRRLLFQLVVAGFCFGNIMLLAFPEYVNPTEHFLSSNKLFFRWFMFVLSLPVLFYSAQDYLKSGFRALKTKRVNIDLPIAIGILVLFFRSTYDIVFDVSPGYFDSLAGLVFFMLIGKYFQRQTYQSLAFDRDYKSFYPIAVTKITPERNQNILLSELKKGDRILLRDEEILPADAILMKGEARIDNSFVTGESRLISKKVGDKIYAGGKQSGAAIELEIIHEVNQSYLTQLWNNDAFNENESNFEGLINIVSKYFVWIILGISLLAGVYWAWADSSKVFQVITAILIIACPCALSLSAPFTLGNIMRILGRKKCYVKDISTLENMAAVTRIVFDKTGTLTTTQNAKCTYEGTPLTDEEKQWVISLAQQSQHPLSKRIAKFWPLENQALEVADYAQLQGKGHSGKVNEKEVALGSRKWIKNETIESTAQTEVWLKIANEVKGKFVFVNEYRKGLADLIADLSSYKLAVLSGDHANEQQRLLAYFSAETPMHFEQSPQDKLNYIQELQVANQENVMMIGDGLNDAGALKQSNVGIALSEDQNSFSPSCDAILSAEALHLLPKFLKLAQRGVFLVKVAFALSFMYNIIGLAFAVSGHLEPVVAAILMPISSISVVLFATLSTWAWGYKILGRV